MVKFTEDEQFDFVIIGSGLGGLTCAYILASEGHRVVVLEKNHQIGGTLQVFSRDKAILDTGVHYIGGLDPGENMYRLFDFFGILDQLKMQRLEADGFDIIRFDDGSTYKMAQGYDAYIRQLVHYFPEEEAAIVTYCDKMREICSNFPLYNLDATHPQYLLQDEMISLNAYDYIHSLTKNERLRNVLAGTNSFLYAGVKESTPFYIHALITNNYLNGAYRLIDGGSQIAILLSRQIRKAGGVILKHKKVVGANYLDSGAIEEVVLQDGTTIRGKNFISNLHPSSTISIFGEDHFLPAYRNRINKLENTTSTFIVHLLFHEHSFPYLNYNIYQYHTEDVWAGTNYAKETWPEQYFISTPVSSKNPAYADSMSVMTYMHFEEVEKWATSFNTIAEPGDRGADYQTFKREKEEQVISKIEKVFPDIRKKIKGVHSSTPLTFRDYIGSPEGSMYGLMKTSSSPLKTIISTKTKVPNLFLTGQNVLQHGILGATLSGLVTCLSFVDRKTLIEKIAKP